MTGGVHNALRALAARMTTTIVAIGVLLLAAYLAAMVVFAKPDGRVVFGDATHHFVQLRSMVFDRDLSFQNEYIALYKLKGDEAQNDYVFTELTVTGRVRNYMPIGPALLWAPLYVLAAAAQWLLAVAGLAARPDGYGRILQMMPGVTGVIAATAAAWLSWRLARRVTDDVSAAVATLAIWLGSHAVYYSLVSPAYSHSASMFTSAIFFNVWLTTRKQRTVATFASWGALAGLCALMRWQDVVFAAIPAIEALRWRTTPGRRFQALAAAGLTWLITFTPQMIVWNALYGQPFAIPQGPSFMQWGSPFLLSVLFSVSHGLFSWAPILVPAVWGPGDLAPPRSRRRAADRGVRRPVVVRQRRRLRLVGRRGVWRATLSVAVPAVCRRDGGVAAGGNERCRAPAAARPHRRALRGERIAAVTVPTLHEGPVVGRAVAA
jgi:hypothetical protein